MQSLRQSGRGRRPPDGRTEGDALLAIGLGVPDEFAVSDLLTGRSYRWRVGRNYVGLAPGGAHVMKIES